MKMTKISSYIFILLFSFLSSLCLACGVNEKSLMQGPFSLHGNEICFQLDDDQRSINFIWSIKKTLPHVNKVIDTYEYSDAPPELLSVFFEKIDNSSNVFVIIRWRLDYQGIKTTGYEYKIFAYKEVDNNIVVNERLANDNNLSGIDGTENGIKRRFNLKKASDVRSYLRNTYASVN